MLLIKDGSDYPLFIGDLQLEYPDWIPGNHLPEGWEEVEESDRPNIFSGQKHIELFPEFVNGKWKRVWSVVDMTQEELDAVAIKDIPQIEPPTVIN